ncbi:SDR family oxidoreductase [Tsukamurella pseudospumae]|uniref:NmrA family transcriptional regulator n=1 Tax=Tsukamurella pseudospumae TaxID=239498 RepID=A0A138AP58_9ACTN|nr:SDR family oxidoreductase [Tsukamurella pseudospumae]KXP00933.1 NmrA family transcriptional regulator [Tsukamurella pseudospumae]KXP12159.1 NmrA family transcriptional regulator [Tsukamurella pseudospumae]
MAKFVVIGGTGLIGSKVVARLAAAGHEAVAAAPSTGVNAVTGEGVDAALAGAEAVIDVANAPAWGDDEVLAFFTASTTNLLTAERQAGVRRHVALSVVGTERLLESGYFRGKMKQEELIRAGDVPFTIVRATQFFEFVAGIADGGTVGDETRLPGAGIAPIASDDVADAVVRAGLAEPVGGIVEVTGPEVYPMDELVRRMYAEQGNGRTVVRDPEATYFGTHLEDSSLLAGPGAEAGEQRFFA